MNGRWIRWVCIGVILAAIPVMAEDKVKVTGDVIHGDTEKKITYIDGNVLIIQGEDRIITQKAEINLDEKHLILQGAVVFENSDVKIEANHLDYYMRKKTGTFSEDVLLRRKENKTKDGTKNDPFSLFGDEIYFEAKTKNFIAKNGRIEHKDFTGKADQIEYSDGKQELLFTGNAYLKKPKGEEAWGELIRINLKAKTFEVEKNVLVHFNVDDETETKPKEEQPKPEEKPKLEGESSKLKDKPPQP